eukprot:gene20269-24310_t
MSCNSSKPSASSGHQESIQEKKSCEWKAAIAKLKLAYELPATGVKEWTGLNVRYWVTKVKDADFHPGEHGGYRHSLLDHDQRSRLELLVFFLVSDEPLSSIPDIRLELSRLGLDFSRDYVTKIFQKWRWSWKKPNIKQVLKYTEDNLRYYGLFVNWINHIDFNLPIKVLTNRTDLRKTRAVGPIGQEVIVKSANPISESCNIMASVNFDGTLMLAERTDTNNARDFLNYVTDMVAANFIREGMIFIIDNAPIHGGADLGDLYRVIEGAGAVLMFLPKYSPELNPMELIFANVKRELREKIIHNFSLSIQLAFRHITRALVRKLYRHCLMPWYRP